MCVTRPLHVRKTALARAWIRSYVYTCIYIHVYIILAIYCTHTNTHIYCMLIYILIYTHTHVYTHIYIQRLIHVLQYSFMCVKMTYTRIFHIHTNKDYKHICTHILNAHIHTHKYSYIFSYIYPCATVLPYVWENDRCMCVTKLMHMCETTHSQIAGFV